MAEPPRVAALLLNWRQAAITEQCLADLLATRFDGLAVLVIDNGSGDGSPLRLRTVVETLAAAGAMVELLALGENLGFAAGMNRGFDWARRIDAEFCLVLNNDLRLPPGFLAPLVQSLVNDERLAAVGPTVLYPDGSVWAQGGQLGFCPNTMRLLAHGSQPAPIDSGPEACDFIPGACVLFRRADVDAVGGFDERYFMYWEDIDLCQRLVRSGRSVVWLPWVRVTHAAGTSAGGRRSPLRKYLMAKNSIRYLRDHGSWRQWLAFACFDVGLLPVSLLLSPRNGWAKACGLLAGLGGRPAVAADVARWHAAR